MHMQRDRVKFLCLPRVARPWSAKRGRAWCPLTGVSAFQRETRKRVSESACTSRAAQGRSLLTLPIRFSTVQKMAGDGDASAAAEAEAAALAMAEDSDKPKLDKVEGGGLPIGIRGWEERRERLE